MDMETTSNFILQTDINLSLSPSSSLDENDLDRFEVNSKAEGTLKATKSIIKRFEEWQRRRKHVNLVL